MNDHTEWRGLQVEDMTREQLVKAFQELNQTLKCAFAAHRNTLDRWDESLTAKTNGASK